MDFPKLNTHLKEAIARCGFTDPTPIQSASLAPIKSGSNVICIAPPTSGRTTTLMISVLQKLGSKAEGEAPRALIFVKDKDAALSLEEAFKPFLRFTDLRIFSAFDQHDMQGQKDTIYHGVDILIGTPSRLSELYFLNGINVSSLKMTIIEDAEFLSKNTDHISIIRVASVLRSCQHLLFADRMYPRFDQLIEGYMTRAQKISLPAE